MSLIGLYLPMISIARKALDGRKASQGIAVGAYQQVRPLRRLNVLAVWFPTCMGLRSWLQIVKLMPTRDALDGWSVRC